MTLGLEEKEVWPDTTLQENKDQDMAKLWKCEDNLSLVRERERGGSDTASSPLRSTIVHFCIYEPI